MNSIEVLKAKYDIRTEIEDGKVLFVGPGIHTDYYRKSKGNGSAWPEIMLLMVAAERTTMSTTSI